MRELLVTTTFVAGMGGLIYGAHNGPTWLVTTGIGLTVLSFMLL